MVAERKAREVAQLEQLIEQYPVVGIAGIERIPAPQFREMRQMLGDNAVIRVSKNTMISRALGGKPMEKLQESLDGPSALILTRIDGFRLARELDRLKRPVTPKGGEIAPQDIIVPKGGTGLKPGPVVGDLQRVGIPAAIERGKVIIQRDTVLVAAGEVVEREKALVMGRLGLKPLKVGIDLRSVYDGGTIYGASELAIDEQLVFGQFVDAGARAFNLAMTLAYPAPSTIGPLLGIAHQKALSLSLGASIPTKETIKLILEKAHRDALCLEALTG